jgi:hypothetical protein
MKDADRKRFAEILMALSEVYDMEFSKLLSEVWFKALSDFSIDEVSKAIFEHMKNPDTGGFKPKPADIIKALKGSTSDQALLAWTKVDKAVRMTGDYESVVFDDPIIHRVITDMGGWIGFGDITEKEWEFKGKEFQQRYRGYTSRGDIPEHPTKMVGLHEDYNSKQGFDIEPPVLIGDEGKAKFVLENGMQPKQLEFKK